MFERKQENPISTYIQPSLEIGKEDDEHEKEANSVADKVMCMREPGVERKMMATGKRKVQPMFNPTAGKTGTMNTGKPIVRKMSTGKSGMKASPNVEQGIHSTKGNGQSLQPELQQEMGSKIGADFGSVRIHTGSHAAEMNQEIGAKAFTHGNDIYFNKRQYDPASDHGKHLLAHELTHTVQQSGVVSPMIQRAAQKTDYGEFVDTPEFNPITLLNTSLGDQIIGGMVLNFNPGTNVDATQIGMVQSVKSLDGLGASKETEPEAKARTVQDGAAKGYKLDREKGMTNPFFGVLDDAKMDKMPPKGQNVIFPPSLAITAGPTYEIGYNYNNGSSVLTKSAVLRDAPHTPIADESVEFESTAMGIAGNQKGMYYGSVSWGWTYVTGQGVVPKPLKLVSMNKPSLNFTAAADLWNKATITSSTRIVKNNNAQLYVNNNGMMNASSPNGGKLSKGKVVTFKGTFQGGGTLYYLIEIINGNQILTRAILPSDLEVNPITSSSDLPVETSKTKSTLKGLIKGYTQTFPIQDVYLNPSETAKAKVPVNSGGKYCIAVGSGTTTGQIKLKVTDSMGRAVANDETDPSNPTSTLEFEVDNADNLTLEITNKSGEVKDVSYIIGSTYK
ncbi:MAG: DUF4157 domain-containing protein [Bacteroidia bacterium]